MSDHFRANGKFDPKFGDWDACLEEAKREGATQIILSSEAFMFLERADVARVAHKLAGRSVRIVLYLRRIDSWMHSRFIQSLKFSRCRMDHTEIVPAQLETVGQPGDPRSQLRILQAWTSVFGADAVTVHLYNVAVRQAGTLAHTTAAHPIPVSQSILLAPHVNVAPTLKSLIAVQVVRDAMQNALGGEYQMSAKTAAKIST